MIDPDKLIAFLDLSENTLQSLDGDELSPVADGGLRYIGILRRAIASGELTAAARTPRVSMAQAARTNSSSPVSRVRQRDPGTSWEAAISQSPPETLRLYKAIYRILSALGPKNDTEMMREMDKRGFTYTPSGLRTRRKELIAAGWVQDSGMKRASDAGKPSIVWEAVPEP